MPIATETGESSKLLTADAEYPCVRRLRHRRLLTFLGLQGYEAAALGSLAANTDACFSVSHLRRLVEQGLWKYAVEYLLRFLPLGMDNLGLEALVLRRFLIAHKAIADILDGTKDGDTVAANYTKYRNHGSSVPHGTIRLRSIILTALYAPQQLRASFDWERVRRVASEIVGDLAYRTPELKHLVLKRGRPMKPHNVFPIGSSYRRRCPHKKQPYLRASSVAKGYIRKRSRLLSSSCSQEPRNAMLRKAMSMVADAVDQSLKAGKLNLEHPVQPKGPAKNPGIPSVLNARGGPVAPVLQCMNLTSHAKMSGATVAPNAQTMFGTFPGTANITGMPSMANADKLTRHVLSSGVPFSRMMFGAPVSQTVPGASVAPVTQAMFGTNTMAGRARYLRMPSVANAGATVAPVTQAVFGTNNMAVPASDPKMRSVAYAGATVAPVTQSMFGTMAGSLSDPKMPSVANAGAVAAVTQAMFGTNTMAGPATDPRMSSVAYTGATIAPVTDAMFGSMAGSASDPKMPLVADTVTNADEMSSPVQRAGLPVSVSQAVLDAERINARKNAGEELNSDEQDLHPKWQRITGSFDEAVLAGNEARDI